MRKKQVPESEIPGYVHQVLLREAAILYQALKEFRKYLRSLKEKKNG